LLLHEFSLRATSVRAAFKEKKMKRNLSLWLGLLAFALLPALAQTPAPKVPMGKIHGRVINPTGISQKSGTVSLSTDNGHTSKYTFPVSSTGDYAGEAAAGTYSVVFRQLDTPQNKMVDSIDGVKIVAGQDLLQDVDMSRKEYIGKLSSEQQKQLAEYKKQNSEVLKANEVVKRLNADIGIVSQNLKDINAAQQKAVTDLGPTATKAQIISKENEIKKEKFTEIETLMLRDTQTRPDASILWAYLGQAQLGLLKFDEAETAYKKVLELEASSKKPNPSTQGAAYSGLGEVYARTGKVPEADAAYDAAAKADPAMTSHYLMNEAIIFYQMGNADAQVAAASRAIQVEPEQPLLYYLKGQGLVQKATVDNKTQRIVLPPGCADAFQKYLELAPNGPYAADAKGILDQAGEKIVSSYRAGKSGKK
jgi:tetratricopeptide (TPR) repeat protein